MHKDEAGAGLRRWGASRGAEHTAENASRPGVSPVMGGRLAVVEELGNDSGMTILSFFLFSLCNRTPWICYRLPANGFEAANLSALLSLKI